jgi:threonylcarbamoyladenosine tRNA methylthiotransferase MtaB
MIEELSFTYLHVFTYSARPGTPAAGKADQVPPAVARERNQVLRSLAAKKKSAFMRSMVGTVVQAITLQTGGVDYTEALTDNYLKMKILGRHKANRWMDLSVESVIESPRESTAGSPNGEMLEGKPLRPVSSNGTAGSESEPLALLA